MNWYAVSAIIIGLVAIIGFVFMGSVEATEENNTNPNIPSSCTGSCMQGSSCKIASCQADIGKTCGCNKG
jgi:hypothetical protein